VIVDLPEVVAFISLTAGVVDGLPLKRVVGVIRALLPAPAS
jgi:hypothetical protein